MLAGVTTIGGLLDINGGARANSFMLKILPQIGLFFLHLMDDLKEMLMWFLMHLFSLVLN